MTMQISEREREREKEITDSSPFFGKFTQAKVLAFEADKNLGGKRRRRSISWGYDGDIIGTADRFSVFLYD